jgi:RNA polymerase sigma-70 factor (ECF subfamily)
LLRLRDRDLAEEAVQETFLAALKARHTFSGRSSERTWLVGILKHKVVDHFRKLSREPFAETVEQEEGSFIEEGEWRGHWRAGDGPLDWGPVPDRKAFWEVLDACLLKLPPRLADAFTLREIDGLSGEEVCKVLRVTPTNLWVMLHRCRAQLRRCLEVNWFGSRSERG